jgi:hypothetical protein
MNVAAGQTARPSTAGNFTTAAPEKQHLPGPSRRANTSAGFAGIR